VRIPASTLFADLSRRSFAQGFGTPVFGSKEGGTGTQNSAARDVSSRLLRLRVTLSSSSGLLDSDHTSRRQCGRPRSQPRAPQVLATGAGKTPTVMIRPAVPEGRLDYFQSLLSRDRNFFLHAAPAWPRRGTSAISLICRSYCSRTSWVWSSR